MSFDDNDFPVECGNCGKYKSDFCLECGYCNNCCDCNPLTFEILGKVITALPPSKR